MRSHAKELYDADDLPPGWDWVERGDSVVYINPRGEETDDDPRGSFKRFLAITLEDAKAEAVAGRKPAWA